MSKGKQPQRGWVRAPRRAKAPEMSAAFKAEVSAAAQAVIDEWKPRYVKEPPKDQRFNYIVDLYAKWHGKSLNFCATYACPGPTAISPSFEARFTRLEYVGGRQFNIAYMRHTEKWLTVEYARPLEECMETLRDDAWYHPN